MYRLLILFVLVQSLSLGMAAEIDKKIKKTSSKLRIYSKNYANINKKMAKTAAAILEQKKRLIEQDAYLKKLQEELARKADSYKEQTQQLQKLTEQQEALRKKQNSIEEELVFVLAKSVSLGVVLDEEFPTTQEALVESEVMQAMLKKARKKAKTLSKLFLQNSSAIEALNAKRAVLKQAIESVDAKRKELVTKQKANKKALKNLELAKASYKKELKKLLQRQNALKKTLDHLNLVKIDAIKKAEEEKARKEAFKRKKIALNEDLPKVKKQGSSYQRLKTIRYRGPKTIAPFKHYTITKKYGTYTDPIYGIKIFNESISLKPKHPNAKVKTVFNGKVIYADKTAVLNNIVIVEHKNGLHTIYANLSQIAPNIHKGKKVKKGAVIGRVKNELVFEVTQKSAHINPIRLFR